MKFERLFFSIVMMVIMLTAAFVGTVIYMLLTHDPFSFETFTFSLVCCLMITYFYDQAEELDKED